MPAIKRKELPACFTEAEHAARSQQDNNFCSPLAIALLTDTPIATVLAMMEAEGRKKGKGTYDFVTNKVIDQLGFKRVNVSTSGIIRSYPKPHCNVLKNVTTHHPRRFPGSFDPTKRYLANCRGHVLAIINGEVQDWSVNKSLQIYKLEEIVRK